MLRLCTSAGSSSPWSIGSPSRLKMRPSVASPTGTVIGPPVSTTSRPRESPSVVSIATARTRSSPRCCWTSHTSRLPPAPALTPSASSSAAAAGRVIVMAWLISGSRSGNTASITTPWISSMRPVLRCAPPEAEPGVGSVAVDASISSLFSWSVWSRLLVVGSPRRRHFLAQSLCAGDYLHDLLRDLCLAGAVHLQRQLGYEFPGVLGRAAHRRHLGAEEACRRLHQRPVDRNLDVVRHEPAQDRLGIGLVVDERARALLLALAILLLLAGDRRLRERQQPLVRDDLAQRRDIRVVDHLHP